MPFFVKNPKWDSTGGGTVIWLLYVQCVEMLRSTYLRKSVSVNIGTRLNTKNPGIFIVMSSELDHSYLLSCFYFVSTFFQPTMAALPFCVIASMRCRKCASWCTWWRIFWCCVLNALCSTCGACVLVRGMLTHALSLNFRTPLATSPHMFTLAV